VWHENEAELAHGPVNDVTGEEYVNSPRPYNGDRPGQRWFSGISNVDDRIIAQDSDLF